MVENVLAAGVTYGYHSGAYSALPDSLIELRGKG